MKAALLTDQSGDIPHLTHGSEITRHKRDLFKTEAPCSYFVLTSLQQPQNLHTGELERLLFFLTSERGGATAQHSFVERVQWSSDFVDFTHNKSEQHFIEL